MSLIEYLFQNFAHDTSGIERDFSESFGVVVKNHEDLYQFQYHMVDAKFMYPLTHECRGGILRHDPKSSEVWRWASRPFDPEIDIVEPLWEWMSKLIRGKYPYKSMLLEWKDDKKDVIV